MNTQEEYQCCYCGNKINKVSPDPCALNLIANYVLPENKQFNQGFFCHLKCFEERIHPTVKVYIMDLLNEVD